MSSVVTVFTFVPFGVFISSGKTSVNFFDSPPSIDTVISLTGNSLKFFPLASIVTTCGFNLVVVINSAISPATPSLFSV